MAPPAAKALKASKPRKICKRNRRPKDKNVTPSMAHTQSTLRDLPWGEVIVRLPRDPAADAPFPAIAPQLTENTLNIEGNVFTVPANPAEAYIYIRSQVLASYRAISNNAATGVDLSMVFGTPVSASGAPAAGLVPAPQETIAQAATVTSGTIDMDLSDDEDSDHNDSGNDSDNDHISMGGHDNSSTQPKNSTRSIGTNTPGACGVKRAQRAIRSENLRALEAYHFGHQKVKEESTGLTEDTNLGYQASMDEDCGDSEVLGWQRNEVDESYNFVDTTPLPVAGAEGQVEGSLAASGVESQVPGQANRESTGEEQKEPQWGAGFWFEPCQNT